MRLAPAVLAPVALALTLLGLAREPILMVAGVLMLGAGMGVGLYGPAYAVLVALHGEAAKKSIAAVSLLGAFGGALGWPLTLAMIETLGWRGACFVWAGAHLLLCLPLYAAVLPDGRAGGHRPLPRRPARRLTGRPPTGDPSHSQEPPTHAHPDHPRPRRRRRSR